MQQEWQNLFTLELQHYSPAQRDVLSHTGPLQHFQHHSADEFHEEAWKRMATTQVLHENQLLDAISVLHSVQTP